MMVNINVNKLTCFALLTLYKINKCRVKGMFYLQTS